MAPICRRSAYIWPAMATRPFDAPRCPAPLLGAPAGGSFWFTTGDPGPVRARGDGSRGGRRRDRRRPGSRACGPRSGCSRPSPSLRVVVLEAERVGWGASGRNGGFCAASLTHGLAQRAAPLPRRDRRPRGGGPAEPRGARRVRARRGHRLRARGDGRPGRRHRSRGRCDELQEWVEVAARARQRARVPRPRRDPGGGPLAALARRRARPAATTCVMLNPAKLAWGLAAAAERRGATDRRGQRRHRAPASARRGVTVASTVAAWSTPARCSWRRPRTAAWMRRLVARCSCRSTTTSLMTEPLTPDAARRRSAGPGREGMSDAGNQFHYFRLSADDRILWGGYDAIYHPGNRVDAGLRPAARDVREARAPVQRRRSPSSTGSGSRTRWGGAIDTTTRFTVTFGEALGGRVHYALGYTGLGVGSSRWAAGHPARQAAPPRLAAAAARARPVAPVPDPAGAGPHARGRDHAPRGDRRRRPRGPPILVPARDGRARDRLRLARSPRPRSDRRPTAGSKRPCAATRIPDRQPVPR